MECELSEPSDQMDEKRLENEAGSKNSTKELSHFEEDEKQSEDELGEVGIEGQKIMKQ